MPGWLRRTLLSNVVLKLVSLALAVLLFVVVHSEKQATVQGTITVAYTVPSGKVLASKPPATVHVAVVGPVSRLQRFRIEELGPVNVDLTKAHEGYFKFNDDMLAVPMGLKIASIRPEGFNLRFEPTYRRALPVHVELEGEPANGYRVVNRTVLPARATVSGPRRVVSALAVLHTEPLSLEASNQGLHEKVAILIPPGIQQIEPDTVEAQIDIAPIPSQAVLKRVPVVVEGTPARGAQVSPATVSVRLAGPADVLAALKPASLRARVIVGAPAGGRLQVTPSIDGLPPNVKVMRVMPAAVEVRLPPATRRDGHGASAP